MTGQSPLGKRFYEGKRVLLTGHSGFKGSWLALWLHRLGAEVTGISLPPLTTPNLFSLAGIEEICDSHFCDIRESRALDLLIKKSQPEVVFHLAAQPLVRTSYQDPVETISTNVVGTAHVLDALRGLECVHVAVMVTTDKVYRDKEQPSPYCEDDALGGRDPYSASKAASEIVIASYRDAFLAEQGIAVASARAGNVIGGGDWSEGRLIPDAIRAWQKKRPLELRRPDAVRPWQHVLDPLAGYLILAEKLWQQPGLAGAYNFGPEMGNTTTVRDVVEIARDCYGRGEVRYGDGSDGPYEADWLELDTAKSSRYLGVAPRWTLTESIEKTMSWYCALHEDGEARELCEAQITEYESQL
jgi:CDP-glucose 4,6-dehydratase